MQQKKQYQEPLVRIVLLQQRHHLLTSSPETGPKPSATWMKDPDIDEE